MMSSDTPSTLGALMAEAVAALNGAGIENARMDARILLARAAGVDGGRISAWPEDIVTDDKVETFRAMIARPDRA